MAMAAVEERTRPARVQRDGKIHYLGRLPEAEARQLEAEARETLAAGGRVAARSIKPSPGCVTHRDDVLLWAAGVAATDDMPDGLKLMLAVLEDARRCLRSRDPRERREAERWFASDDRSHLYAFATICEAFGVDPEFARRGVIGVGSESGGGGW